jgi:hypothetical protein
MRNKGHSGRTRSTAVRQTAYRTVAMYTIIIETSRGTQRERQMARVSHQPTALPSSLCMLAG